MTRTDVRRFTAQEIEEAIGRPLDDYAFQCHAVSAAVVMSDLFEPGEARVMRGTALGVGGQHSWVHCSPDPHDERAPILDCSLWSYVEGVEKVHWATYLESGRYRPHGTGSIFTYGKPSSHGGLPLELDADLSEPARLFLALLGPLDMRGWMEVAHAPVGGWPAKEIWTAMYADQQFRHMIPVDLLGNWTDVNPGGLYIKEA